MQIVIFKSSKNKSSSYKMNGMFFLSLFILLVGLSTFLLTSSVYFYGYKTGYNELSEDRKNDIAKYKKEINLIKIENKNKMDFFSKKLVSISAQMQTINALGNKIAEIAKIDKKDFNFKRPKYIGGINKVSIEFEYDSKFDKYLDSILSELSDKQDDLNYTSKIVNNLEMKEQFFPMGFPSEKGYISSTYGDRVNPISKKQHFHKGIDIAYKLETDIVSLAAGKVIFSGKKYGYGNLVIIDHLNGYTTKYAHNNRNLVKEGETVKKGQLIAKMGSTGHSTGPHIHLEVLKNNKNINPNKFIHYKEKFSKKD
mgnify:CR=1 FL=1